MTFAQRRMTSLPWQALFVPAAVVMLTLVPVEQWLGEPMQIALSAGALLVGARAGGRTQSWILFAVGLTLAVKIRELKPRTVILPYWQARHPDHYRAGELGYEACFLAGLKKLDEYSEPHRPFKIIYSSIYADVKPSFIVDISTQFERRMTALLSYTSQYGGSAEGVGLFPQEAEIRERLGAIARFYGNLIGVRYGEPFVVKEAIRIDDIVSMPVRSI